MDIAIYGPLFLLVFFLVIGVPIAFALAGAGLISLFLMDGVRGLEIAATVPWQHSFKYALAAIPMFVFMGHLLMGSNTVEKIFKTVNLFTGRLAGSLGIASTIACGIFAACSGSGVAATATVGKIAYPELKRHGYNESLAASLLASGGSIAPIIPPSALLIVYAATVGLSVGKLFMAAIIPGLILVFFLSLFIFILGLTSPKLVPKTLVTKATLSQKLRSLKYILPFIVLGFIVLFPIYTGLMTANESAAAGAVGAFLLRLFSKDLSWSELFQALKDTVNTTCFVLIILVGANILSVYYIYLGVPDMIAASASAAQLTKFEIGVLVICLQVIIGAFLDPVSQIMIVVPAILPLMVSYGYDPIWFGVITALLAEQGTLTPPVGLHLYVIQGITGLDWKRLVAGLMPFIFVWMIVIVLLWVFPSLTLWLPGKMMN